MLHQFLTFVRLGVFVYNGHVYSACFAKKKKKKCNKLLSFVFVPVLTEHVVNVRFKYSSCENVAAQVEINKFNF